MPVPMPVIQELEPDGPLAVPLPSLKFCVEQSGDGPPARISGHVTNELYVAIRNADG